MGRYGVLKPFEDQKDVPRALRVAARLARLGIRSSLVPQYAKAFEAIGPAAIKLGQALATRPDLIGPEAAHDLERLQDKLPAFAFSQVQVLLERELGGPVEQFFSSVDPVPVGAASIAQVHKAVTLTGQTVAVKVLRPHIEEVLSSAIETYAWAAYHLEKLGGEAARLRPRVVIQMFQQWVTRELDFRLEAANAAELKSRMAAEPLYRVPAVDWSRTTRRILTIEWIDGIPLTDKAALKASGHDLKAIAATSVLIFLKQAIVEGYFHADLHQGNMFVDQEGRLAAVDFGIMGRLAPLGRRYLAEILYGLLTQNYRRVAEIHFEAGYVPPYHNMDDFAVALRAVGDPIVGLAIKDISIGRLLEQLFAITRLFDMQTQPHLLLLQKSMVMIEGLAASLDPEANMWEIAGPFVESWVRDELGPEARAADSLIKAVREIRGLPNLLRRFADLAPPPKGAAPPMPPLPEPVASGGIPWWFVALGAGLGAGFILGATLPGWLL